MMSLDWLCPLVPPHPHSAGPGRRAALESWVNKGMTAGWFCTHQAVFQRELDSSALQSHLQPPFHGSRMYPASKQVTSLKDVRVLRSSCTPPNPIPQPN